VCEGETKWLWVRNLLIITADAATAAADSASNGWKPFLKWMGSILVRRAVKRDSAVKGVRALNSESDQPRKTYTQDLKSCVCVCAHVRVLGLKKAVSFELYGYL
jgi:hypothetical protein